MFLKIKKIPKVNWSSENTYNFKPKFSTLFFCCFGLMLFGLGRVVRVVGFLLSGDVPVDIGDLSVGRGLLSRAVFPCGSCSGVFLWFVWSWCSFCVLDWACFWMLSLGGVGGVSVSGFGGENVFLGCGWLKWFLRSPNPCLILVDFSGLSILWFHVLIWRFFLKWLGHQFLKYVFSAQSKTLRFDDFFFNFGNFSWIMWFY